MGRQKSASNKKMKNNEVVRDQFSSLPDDILINILSRLPFRSVVVFSTISRRWLRLWTLITRIDIDHNDKYPRGNPVDFWKTFRNALPKLTSPIINRFRLRLLHCYYTQTRGCWSALDSCIRTLSKRNVQHIEVRSCGSGGVYGRLVPTTTCVFQIRSLVSLDLGTSGSIAWRLSSAHDGYEIDLPNLKKLRLVVDPSQHTQLEEVIKSCPSLEDLSFTITTRPSQLKDKLPSELDRSIRVSSRVLKRLCITLHLSFAVIIEAPKLEDLIYMAPYNVPNHDDDALLALLNSISHVKTLKLDAKIGLISNLVKSIFPNMTRFTWTLRSSHDFCPCLEVLVLKFDYRATDCGTVIPNDPTYTCLFLASVRRLELKTGHVCRDKRLMKLARHLLASAPVLEEFVLGVENNSTMDDKTDELSELYRSLMDCPRGSSRCRIEVCLEHKIKDLQ